MYVLIYTLQKLESSTKLCYSQIATKAMFCTTKRICHICNTHMAFHSTYWMCLWLLQLPTKSIRIGLADSNNKSHWNFSREYLGDHISE